MLQATTLAEGDVDLSVPDQMTLLGRVYKAVVEKKPPDLPHICHGCASHVIDADGDIECSWWYMYKGGSLAGKRVHSLAQDHLKSCGHIYSGDQRRIYLEVVQIAPVEPGENGYIPDTFIPGKDIHAVTRLVCKGINR